MGMVGIAAGIGASFFWALGSLLALTPARSLGAFELTRTQLVSSFFILFLLVTALHRWIGLSWNYAPAFAIASLIGVVGSNLAMMACLARGCPRSTQLLMAMNTPIAALLGVLVHGETLMTGQWCGIGLMTGGVVMALLGGKPLRERVISGEADIKRLFETVALGLVAAACNAIGLAVMKPVISAGVDPLAATAIRTGGGALLISMLALWPSPLFAPAQSPTKGIVLWAIVPGLLGYVVAVSLQLLALAKLGTGVAAAVSSAAPILILPMLWLSSGKRPASLAWIGAGVVVGGLNLLIHP